MKSKQNKPSKGFAGARVIIIAGDHAGEEGVCVGKSEDEKKWAISPDASNEILQLEFEREFGLLLNMSEDAQHN